MPRSCASCGGAAGPLCRHAQAAFGQVRHASCQRPAECLGGVPWCHDRSGPGSTTGSLHTDGKYTRRTFFWNSSSSFCFCALISAISFSASVCASFSFCVRSAVSRHTYKTGLVQQSWKPLSQHPAASGYPATFAPPAVRASARTMLLRDREPRRARSGPAHV